MALKEFILEQLYVVTKSVEELKKLQQALKNSPLFEFLKEEEFDQGETIINKRNPRLVKMEKKKNILGGRMVKMLKDGNYPRMKTENIKFMLKVFLRPR